MAALGARSIALLLGAGYSGSYIYNNQDKARAIVEAILKASRNKEQNGDNLGPQPPPPVSNIREIHALSNQVDRLTREVARNRTDPVLVLGSGYKGSLATLSDALTLLGWAVTAVSLGGVVYYVAFRKRLRLTDLAWVSQTTFNGTIEAMQKGISRVSDTVGAVRHDLGRRLGLLKGQVDDVRDSLSRQIEDEVGVVQKGVTEVGGEVAEVKDVLGNVETRIDELDSKLDYATNGIIALVKAVSSIAPDHLRPGSAFYELRQFADLSGKAPEIGNGMVRQRVSTGLRGLLAGKDDDDNSLSKTRSMDVGSPSWQSP